MAVKSIGAMRSVVEVLKNLPTDAVTGGAVDNYGLLLSTRGELRKSSGGRALSFGEVVNSESYSLRLRYQSLLASNLRVDTKFIINGLLYSIDTWELVREIKSYYEIKINIHKSGSVTVSVPAPIGSDEGVQAIWLTTTPGTSTISSGLLSGKTILGVDREGVGYQVVSTTPLSLQVMFSGSTLTFLNNFAPGEIVYILYK